MIFVTVGSQKFQFNRLLQAVDGLVASGVIQEEVFAQSGACTYIPKYYTYQPFLNRENFSAKMAQSDIVITHGGTGVIIGALKAGKKVIAIPRLKKYGEHVDDHQCQLIEQFEKANLICKCDDLNQLEIQINAIKTREFNSYQSNTKQYLKEISKYINNL